MNNITGVQYALNVHCTPEKMLRLWFSTNASTDVLQNALRVIDIA